MPILMMDDRGNDKLIEALAQLKHLRPEWTTLDPTWGPHNVFWKRWRPDTLVGMDLIPGRGPDGVVDMRHLPFADDSFDVVSLDGPYKLNGTAGSHESDERYGVDGDDWTAMSWQDVFELNRAGIAEAVRVARHRVLVKCQPQVCSGAKRWQSRDFANYAELLGCKVLDQLHVGGFRVQPERTRKCVTCSGAGCDAPGCTDGRTPSPQVHAQQNYSTMLVLRPPGRSGRRAFPPGVLGDVLGERDALRREVEALRREVDRYHDEAVATVAR